MKSLLDLVPLVRRLLRCQLAALCLLAAAQAGERTILARVFVVGDSTAAEYKANDPCRGWGQYLQGYFKEGVVVLNRAVGGRSAKSFQAEGLWRQALQEKPDFVLIQFGVNDACPAGRPAAPTAEGEYRECLARYVTTARSVGARPILVTPLQPRNSGLAGESPDLLSCYAAAMREVAAKMAVPLVDLNALSAQLFERLGRESGAQLSSSPDDTIHLSELGAKAMAELAVRELRRVAPGLASQLAERSSPLSHPLAARQ